MTEKQPEITAADQKCVDAIIAALAADTDCRGRGKFEALQLIAQHRDAEARRCAAIMQRITSNADGSHLHAAHETPQTAGDEAREILAQGFEPQFPVEAAKARQGLHFMMPSSWAVEAIQAALDRAAIKV